jgi:hypothetical protein
VWKRKYYHDLKHREEQHKHTRTTEQKIKENLRSKNKNLNDNEKKENIAKNKNNKIQDSDTIEINSTGGDPGLYSGTTAPEGGDFLWTLL